MVDRKRLPGHQVRILFVSAPLDIRAISPNFDVRQVPVNPKSRLGNDLRQTREEHAIVAVEMREPHWNDGFISRLEERTKPRKFPLGDEFVAVQKNAPVAR